MGAQNNEDNRVSDVPDLSTRGCPRRVERRAEKVYPNSSDDPAGYRQYSGSWLKDQTYWLLVNFLSSLLYVLRIIAKTKLHAAPQAEVKWF